ncbi:hypothetical protein SAMN02745166_00095 [Prosthecobacter debontii]|uniref:Uncharacterized protein n=1 Tax=Prosthecobacter debontii TaxID=48467 RepID=A0A1T4WF54_9BACT|nr:hypothetical protein [Prosthecobacter debontii]SKA75944.1 hypothetical protein SAMN02745166_00095 [Prosthecobacter debontii]
MKLLPALLFLLLSLSPAQADSKDEARAMSREAFKLEREMYEKLPQIEERVPELKALLEQSREASRSVQEALKTHSALAEARAQRDAAFNQLTTAIGKQDAAGKQAAQDAYRKAENHITEEGRKVPEIAALMEVSANAGAAYMKKKEEAYATQPETAALAQQAAELRAKASELRRASR